MATRNGPAASARRTPAWLAAIYLAAPLTLAQAQGLDSLSCATPAHCGESCARELLLERGSIVDSETGRRFFVDIPCNLTPDDDILLILNLHGAGSIGNWQRHYFPALDYKDEYRLVVITPTAEGSGGIGDRSVRMWTAADDDAHLRNVVDAVVDHFGPERITSFWLAGHSQGGMTSNRIVCSQYFRGKVDGWLSLSGGRIGRAEIPPEFFGPDGPPAALSANDAGAPRPGAAVMPECDISYIFATGELEIVSLPVASPIADRYDCDARVRENDIKDTEPGYVTGATPGRPASWGRAARPGTAEVYVYPNCRGDRVVADVVRLDKGHTEGLEPHVTEALIRMMAAAPGGKLSGN
ncbi:MAG: alpha/beta hydrolase [Gammaproteobacteria bacterium]|jgi:hypothetical protein